MQIMPKETPILAITMGDAAGVGPEIIAKALSRQNVREWCRPLVVGDAEVMRRVTEKLELALRVDALETPGQATYRAGILDVLDLDNIQWDALTIGEINTMAGKAAVEYVTKAAELVQSRTAAGIVTAPLNKEAMQSAGYHYIGHTELLADLTHSEKQTTMLATSGPDDGQEHNPLRVVHVTRHIPFREIADRITTAQVLETIEITDLGLKALKIPAPKLAVAALNPHGGEGGILGQEEIEEIGPAVEAAQAQGIDASGPYPADSIYFRVMDGEFDAVVAMYHDQGHIAIKVYGFEASVTVTLGLPIVRTSVDHGTAFDIAWQGVANPRSMVEAIRLAAQMTA
jgi:4-hydroxythreonine-4-phosphate dehydrogenase